MPYGGSKFHPDPGNITKNSNTSNNTDIIIVIIRNENYNSNSNHANSLVSKEAANRLEALLAPVDVISQEEVIRLKGITIQYLWRRVSACLRREAAAFKQLQQVRVPHGTSASGDGLRKAGMG